MRLRYLHIPELKPLRDVSITFGHEPVLGRKCTVHFIAGVNGTGKSRLLRAITEIFLSLNNPPDQENRNLPPFPVTIAYDIKSQPSYTVYYRYTGYGKSSAYMVVLDYIPLDANVDWEHFHQFAWRSMDKAALPYRMHKCLYGDTIADVRSYLPSTVLAYTSGSTREWETIFAQPERSVEESSDAPFPQVEQEPGERRRIERPLGWNSSKEAEYKQSQQEGDITTTLIATPRQLQAQGEGLIPGRDLFPGEDLFPRGGQPPGIGIFIQPQALKLVVCAIALSQVLDEFQKYPDKGEREKFEQMVEKNMQQGQYMDGMRAIFNSVDWLWPITIGLRIAFSLERLQTLKNERALLHRLYHIATRVLCESEPDNSRILYFDLARTIQSPIYAEFDSKDTLQALSNILGGMNTRAFDIFKQLLELQNRGILEDVTIALQKRKIEGTLLYDQLSDGERVLLGRMALFHLLKGSDDTLIILDEPETHFNDLWKREVVDMIDSALRDDTSEIVLATHSSIALTDVFDSEIIVLKKDPRDATVYATHPTLRTFGAAPDEILREVFGAQDSIGLRASEFLDLILTIASRYDLVQAIWNTYREEQEREQRSIKEQDQDRGQSPTKKQDFKQSPSFATFRQYVKQESGAYIASQSDADLEDYLARTLRAVYDYTQRQHSEVNIEYMLDVLQERLGPGYYQFEFRRRLRALRKDTNAASN